MRSDAQGTVRGRIRSILRFVIYGLSTLIGLLAFFYPFLLPLIGSDGPAGQAGRLSPLLLSLFGGLAFLALLLEIQGEAAMDAKFVALLGILVAINATLRFMETAIPGPAGFSPIFFLVVLTGYVYGGRFGFLMGVLTLFVSALITGGVGPWLPYQMITAGWIGLFGPLARLPVRLARAEGTRWEVLWLGLVGGVWGFAYGMLMNLWFWPYAVGLGGQQWEAGLSMWALLRRYGAFYAATSLVWDAIRGVGTVILTALLGRPTLRVLRRFDRRFRFTYRNLQLQTERGAAEEELVRESCQGTA
jgi:energy-coupling factor transport system substrate-specific component